jgi:hypothetical protein
LPRRSQRPGSWTVDTLELMMGGDKKDDKSKEEAVRIHWSTDPVHANLHSYYKLASNLLDYQKYFKSPSQEAAAGPKRARSSSSNADGAEDAGSGMNPAKKKREDNKGKASGSYRDTRHWLPASPASAYQDRGHPYHQNRYEDRYSHNYGYRGGYSGYGGYEGHRGGRGNRSRGRGRPGVPPY